MLYDLTNCFFINLDSISFYCDAFINHYYFMAKKVLCLTNSLPLLYITSLYLSAVYLNDFNLSFLWNALFNLHIICWSYLNFVINENIFVVLFFLFNLAYNDKKGGGNMIGELNIYSCYSFQNSTILIKDLCKRIYKTDSGINCHAW